MDFCGLAAFFHQRDLLPEMWPQGNTPGLKFFKRKKQFTTNCPNSVDVTCFRTFSWLFRLHILHQQPDEGRNSFWFLALATASLSRQYYLYNWKCPKIDPQGIGLVLLWLPWKLPWSPERWQRPYEVERFLAAEKGRYRQPITACQVALTKQTRWLFLLFFFLLGRQAQAILAIYGKNTRHAV